MKKTTLAVLFLIITFCCWSLPADAGPKKPGKAASAASQAASQSNRSTDTAPAADGYSSSSGTAGTGGPQSEEEATVITDVNTAETVRVNNLANLEALLNIIANGGEILGFLLGVPAIMLGVAGAIIGGKKRWIGFCIIGAGLFMIVGGLALPGIINWLVASARDANLFS